PLTVAFQTDGIACGSVVRNSATIATSAREDNLDNNRSQTVMTTVQCLPPIFKIAKTDHRDTIKPGEHDTYEITVTNTSGFAASATVQDQFPSNQLTFQSASNGGRFDGSTITWNNLSFQSGEKKTLTVQAQAHGDLRDGAVITNTVQVVNGPTDTDATTVSVPPPPPPQTADVSVTKTGPATVRQGAVITYTLTARNDGPAIATTVAVQDVIPQGLRFLPSDSDSRSPHGRLPDGRDRVRERRAQ
ncbi:DUF11 domain-containing protein, partial [Candidatus Peregrinibacteria bacterium]|nr:DUF11 domain-containing protein [Candidatus Peregrinibacteria bacterium]